MEIKIHKFQISILKELLFRPQARFRDLKKVDITNDHFTFHLKHLIKEGLVLKTNQGYYLTDKGKEFANRMDNKGLKIERQAKVAVALHAIRTKNGVKEYLVHKRLKEPFYGWYGSSSGKIKWGENPLDCAKRELLKETGLTGNFSLKGIVHYHHIHEDSRFLEDKYFWIYRIDNPKGKFKKKVKEGENIWITEKEYKKLKNVFATFDETIKVITSKNLVYLDIVKVVKNY